MIPYYFEHSEEEIEVKPVYKTKAELDQKVLENKVEAADRIQKTFKACPALRKLYAAPYQRLIAALANKS